MAPRTLNFLIALLSGAATLAGCEKKNTMPASPDLPAAFETGQTPTQAARQVDETPGPHPGRDAGVSKVTHAGEGRAKALLKPTAGNNVRGVIELVAEGERVHITGSIHELKPGLHGFHIHEKGDCSAPDAQSAGGHFSPEPHEHGGPGAKKPHHAGDYGNIKADKSGVAQIDIWSDLPLLKSGPSFVVGRAFVVHADKDDLKSQPAGASGARVACGVIAYPGSEPY